MRAMQATVLGVFSVVVAGAGVLVAGCGEALDGGGGAGSGGGETFEVVARAATSSDPSMLSFQRSFVPPVETLTSVAFGSGKVVAVGRAATVEVSTNGGQEWSTVAAPFAGDAQSVVFDARTHLFYALVTDPSPATQRILSSPDGRRWTPLSALPLVGHATLSLANGRFFASGHDGATGAGTVYASADARVWTRSPTSLGDALFDEVVFGAGRWAAHASDEDGNSAVWISTDAATWLRTHQLGQGGTTIAFGAGRFVAGRDRRLEASPDGVTWAVVLDTEDASFSTLLFVAGAGFRAFDIGGRIWTSPDGLAWTQTAGADVVSVLDVALVTGGGGAGAGAGNYVAVGAGGSLAFTATLAAWTVINPPGGVSYTTIAFGSGKFVMADRGRLQTSTDAATWQTVVPLSPFRTYLSVKRAGNAFFAIYVCGSDRDRCIADSSDGINWLHSYSFSEEKPQDIAFGNGKYVFVQMQGFISNFTSFCCLSTFQNDVFQLPSGEPFVAVAFGAGRFVAVTAGGETATSSDGTNWTPHAPAAAGLPGGVTSLAFGNGAFVAATPGGLFASSDGLAFTRVFTSPAGTAHGQVSFASRLFFFTGDAGFLASSADGRAWSVVPSQTTETLYQFAFGNALYAGGGDHDTVVTSR